MNSATNEGSLLCLIRMSLNKYLSKLPCFSSMILTHTGELEGLEVACSAAVASKP